MKVPFFSNRLQEDNYGQAIRENLDRVIRRGAFILSDEVRTLEQSLAEYCGVKHVIGVGNASDALYLAVRAAHIPAGSEVLTSPYTFFASTSSLVRNGLKPVFVDIDPDTFHIDENLLDRHRTAKTKGILSVDLFSHPTNSSSLVRYTESFGLTLLEDSAEAFGMKWGSRHAGTSGLAGVLSFFPTKTLGCFGDGGAILTNHDEVARECRIGRVHGAEKKYHHSFIGINSRLDEIQAAILNIKLKHVDSEIQYRHRIASKYKEGLTGIEQIKLPYVPEGASPVWYVFAPRFEKRDQLARFLAERGVETFVYWPKPLHLQECFADLGYKYGDFPQAEKLCETTLALPMFPGMSDTEINHVIESIRSFFQVD